MLRELRGCGNATPTSSTLHSIFDSNAERLLHNGLQLVHRCILRVCIVASVHKQHTHSMLVACIQLASTSSQHPQLHASPKHRIMSCNSRALLIILRFCMTNTVELGSAGKHRAPEPDGVALHRVRHNFNLNFSGGLRWGRSQASHVGSKSASNTLADILLQASLEVFEHRAASGQYNVLVQPAPSVDRRRHDRLVNDLRQWLCEVRRVDLRVEKELRRKKCLVSDVHSVRGFRP